MYYIQVIVKHWCWTYCPCPSLICRIADSHASYLLSRYSLCNLFFIWSLSLPCLVSEPLSTGYGPHSLTHYRRFFTPTTVVFTKSKVYLTLSQSDFAALIPYHCLTLLFFSLLVSSSPLRTIFGFNQSHIDSGLPLPHFCRRIYSPFPQKFLNSFSSYFFLTLLVLLDSFQKFLISWFSGDLSRP